MIHILKNAFTTDFLFCRGPLNRMVKRMEQFHIPEGSAGTVQWKGVEPVFLRG